jgi:hypothetical protein
MYVGEARFALARPPDSIDLASFVTLPFIERMDPAIKHRRSRRPRRCRPGSPRRAQPASAAALVRSAAGHDCIRSRYQFEGKLPIGIQIANKLRDGPKKIADYLEFESELTLRPPAEVIEMGFAALTGVDTPPVGALEQNIFYVNQVMQFGKLLAVLQAHPTEAKATVVTIFIALAVETSILAKKKEFVKVPVLRNMVPPRCSPARARSTPATRSARGCRSMRATK